MCKMTKNLSKKMCKMTNPHNNMIYKLSTKQINRNEIRENILSGIYIYIYSQ